MQFVDFTEFVFFVVFSSSCSFYCCDCYVLKKKKVAALMENTSKRSPITLKWRKTVRCAMRGGVVYDGV